MTDEKIRRLEAVGFAWVAPSYQKSRKRSRGNDDGKDDDNDDEDVLLDSGYDI